MEEAIARDHFNRVAPVHEADARIDRPLQDVELATALLDADRRQIPWPGSVGGDAAKVHNGVPNAPFVSIDRGDIRIGPDLLLAQDFAGERIG